MASGDRGDSDSSEEPEYVIHRVVYRPPAEYVRPPDALPFLIPHRSFLEKAEVKEEFLEPLAGFTKNQETRRKKFRDEVAVEKTVEVKTVKRKRYTLSRRATSGVKESAASREAFPKEGSAKQQVQLADQKELISRLRNDPSIGFLYMIYAATRDSEIYNPYCLKVVPFDQLDRHNFFTISTNGVTHYSTEDMIFTPLDKWEREYDYYCRIVEIRTFKQFRMWKAYYVWRKSVIWKKYSTARNKIESKLLILNSDFQSALLTIQSKYFDLDEATFTDLRKRGENALFYFWESQMAKLEILQQHIKDLHIQVKQLMYDCCIAALWNEGFLIDDANFTIGEAAKSRRIRSDKPKMTYVDQANKRHFCERISCFICLVDYMMSHMLHSLIMNTLNHLCSELKTHYSFLPSEELLHTPETDTHLEKPRPPDAPELPLFIVDVLINTEEICFDPSEEIFKEVYLQLSEMWHETVLSVRNYLPDTYFDVFTQPMINAKQEDRLIGYGPKLIDILEEDPHRTKAIKDIDFYFRESFEAAAVYMGRCHFMLEFFQENSRKEHSTIKRERDIERFRGLLTNYHQQIDEINKLVEEQSLGVFHLWFKRFKEIAMPSPLTLLLVLESVLPWIGKHKIDSLIHTAQHAMKNLHVVPKTTIEYVHYLEFLENVQPLNEKIEAQMEYTKELYDLIEEFRVPCPPEDIAHYLGFSVTATSLRNTIQKKVAETDKMVGKFTQQINKDFSTLISEVGDIQDESNQPWLIDIQSNSEEAKVTLDALYDQLMKTQKTSNLYKSYQKRFRLEVTRFEMLDDVINSVKLRKLLWDSLEDWDVVVEEYTKRDFSLLDPDEINLFVAKNVKNINTFEKYIPPNEIVPKLKDKVQIMKDKLPVITYLRNPSLKNRHWSKIESLLNFHFKSDLVITLELLETLQVFKYEDELQEISKQASSEASLEALLKEVEENWEELEFTVLTYHDMKDVYMLGGTDDIMQVLDDSFIKVNTISSSKNVGPIKQRVDEWARLLDVFSSTLEELWACQQTWLYLEPIFSAPDIQRQLPNEAKMFTVVDKSYKETMRKIAKMPLALRACTHPGLLEEFQNNNYLLEQIMKCLDAYLESKRVVFPRFYFLSNDELLEILAQTRNPFAVQPFLRKCFDAIAKLEFGSWAMEEVTEETEEEQDDEEGEGAQATQKVSTDILSMTSPEGETVGLTRGLKVRGNIEDWLGKVEESMFASIRKRMIGSLKDYVQRPLQKWILSHPSQIVLTVSQIMWAQNVHQVFAATSNVEQHMKDFEQACNEELNKLAGMVRGELEHLQRSIVCCLITIEVHARDNITLLVKGRVTESTSFEWLKQLRYYWDVKLQNCIARMSNSAYKYGYEYLGASPRLVITPLTDKCYLCLLGALQLDLGGAPAGPAGTGKTETTKDLAKSMAIMCVVFNCSDGLDYKIMGQFFAGLAESGGWCCFDEFNRIDIEVLSVIAQQLITIRNAKLAKQARFMFEGREIRLNPTCAAFITMNPGYAGRTELPDNLKALFRPVSMMVPDYGLIAEVILYSEGFESSHVLANKMVQMYKLCSEQLSQQDHYDFGMRAVKSVLVMAGSLKRANPDQTEDIVLINALCDSNLPKFLVSDAELFQNIVNDLFPGVTIPEKQRGALLKAIVEVMVEHNLQQEQTLIRKVIQFNDTMIVRHGVMLCGPTGGGKTTIINVLKYTLTRLFEEKVPGPYYRPVTTYTLNPKSVSPGELYGEVSPQTMEWRDGLLGIVVRTAVKIEAEEHQWIICDGPVDAVWIENLNTALDDNKMLCLANSERIKFTPWVHMVFETGDLTHASPATVSRVGMVYVDPEELKWLPFVRTWISTLTIPDNMKEYLEGLFTSFFEGGLTFIKKSCDYAIQQVDISKACQMCKLLECLIQTPGAVDPKADELRNRNFLCQSYVFSFLWAVGGNIVDHSREIFEVYVRSLFDEHPDARIPSSGDLWNLYLNVEQKKMDVWDKIKPDFKYTKIPFFDIVVPTNDTTKFGYILEMLLSVNSPVLFTGLTGVGKTIVAKTVLNTLAHQGDTIQVLLNCSAQTSSPSVQEAIEERLKKHKKGLLGPPTGKKIVIFCDDVNMPKLEVYGAQPPIELLRQYLDFHGLYDREKLFWKNIEGVIITAACAPPGGGRNPLTPRFVRHFAMLLIPTPDESALKTIFKPIVTGFLQEFPKTVGDIGGSIVSASIDIYARITTDLLPTPEKHHYVFNLRDLSKCVQGLLQADPSVFTDAGAVLRLFYHESLRVFHDRLINKQDKTYFFRLMNELCIKHFNNSVLTLPEGDIIDKPPELIFGDFMNMGASKENRIYEEITNFEKLQSVLQEYLDDFNLTYQKDVRLVFFMDAMEHITRTARILRVQRGNALLVGTAGMGKKSVTRLASHCCDYKCFQIELACNYNTDSFHDDLRKLYYIAGVDNLNTAFLMTDTEIVEEVFLEDINNILNSGEVPNLFDASENKEAVMSGMRPQAKSVGLTESNQEGLFAVFIGRVKSNLHLVLCMSPVGDAFRRRCRMFPSLINCCTIDWFADWPDDALLSVAQTTLKDVGDEDTVTNLGHICVLMHQSVREGAAKFYDQMRRRYYITPSNYLALIKLYLIILQVKRGEIMGRRERIGNGLKKLLETNELVDTMKVQLVAFEPELKRKSADTETLMKHLVKEQAQADKVRQTVMADEHTAKMKAEETQLLADDATKDLEEALPAMDAAMKALDSLNKNDINELKVFNKPPTLVKFVMEAINLLLGQKLDWKTAKVVLGDLNFLKKLQEYDKDSITDNLLKKLKHYVDNPDFVPEKVAAQSKACKSLCMWVIAMNKYAIVYRIVEPKKAKVAEAETELNAIMKILREKQQRLADVEAQIAALEASYDASIAEKKHLEDTIELTANRLVRAGRLTSALGDEKIRWEESVMELDASLITVIGDVLIAAGFVAYLGAFTNDYRVDLVSLWLDCCKKVNLPTSKIFSLSDVLTDQFEIRKWNMFDLPRDTVSTENAIIVTRAQRWPLMIDPQEQANQWIRHMENENGLKVIKQTDPNFMRVVENAIRLGLPILLEEVGEVLDPALNPILLKATFSQAGRLLIRLGESEIEYDENFRLYITTKFSNPHYLPETCIIITLINFTVTPSGLEDQLLSDVVRLILPELEIQRSNLISSISNDKNQLFMIEDKILQKLFTSKGNILDDEALIDSLNESKETAGIIAVRLVEAEQTEKTITGEREKYRTVANRGSVLYFVVMMLGEIDPMYQFSLKYFNQIFSHVVEVTEKLIELEQYLHLLLENMTLAVYMNVSRGLFERHKLVFSFMLCANILRGMGTIKDEHWNFLLRGPLGMRRGGDSKPDIVTLSPQMWMSAKYLAENFSNFQTLVDEVLTEIYVKVGTFEQVINIPMGDVEESSTNWNVKLDDFEKLMLIKALQEEKLVFAISAYVREKLGKPFVESPQISLPSLYQDMSCFIPLIFVLSTGSDPFGALYRFAVEIGVQEKLQSISLGQGQGPIAEKLIVAALAKGEWVFLQNCHLATSWMLSMEKIVHRISDVPEKTHPDFRLFLSSMPSKAFPVSVLQNSVKVTTEPPKGLRANVKRAFADMTEDFFEAHALGPSWRKMVFGICFFHAIIQERKKFGPLGWNITYEFTDSDRECAILNLQMFCEDNTIPWDALEYITGEIVYGGRVTDYWDLRCLKTILTLFFSPRTLEAGYLYSVSGIYFAPETLSQGKLMAYKEYIDDLPLIEHTEIFGMHENANVVFQKRETNNIINIILEVNPKTASSAGAKSPDEIVYELADSIMEQIDEHISTDEPLPALLVRDEKNRLPSLSTVIFQEVDRFNKLLAKLHSSLSNLQKAIKGFVVMSEDLEALYNSCMNNQIPAMWAAVAYPSIKNLGSWIHDLDMRTDLIKIWVKYGPPISFWISGIFFPQGFLTGVLQTHARKYSLPIDNLDFNFDVEKIILEQQSIHKAHVDAGTREVPEAYQELSAPIDGVLVHGLFLDAASWNMKQMVLAESNPGDMNPPMPVIRLTPTTKVTFKGIRYQCPLYKTGVRAGTLSTTGHSTNFVMTVLLPSLQEQSFWILMGTALLMQTTD